MKRKIRFLAGALVIIVAVSVVGTYFLLSPRYVRQINLGGLYSARVDILGNDLRGFEYGTIRYIKDGSEHVGYYNSYLNSSMNWIKNNTSENAVFLNWWDYGQMIVGFAGRESVNKNPSQEALISVVENYRSTYKELDAHGKLVDVANALVASDENTTRSLMAKYGASYVLITVEDVASKVNWIYHFAGLNATMYYYPWTTSSVPSQFSFRSEYYTELGKQTMIYRFQTNSNLNVFTQVYSDENVKIFKLST